MFTQSDKDALLSTARAAYESVFNAVSTLPVDTAPAPDLQAQVTQLAAQVASQGETIHSLQIASSAMQSKIDMARVALA